MNAATTGAAAPLTDDRDGRAGRALRGVSKRFVKPLDLAAQDRQRVRCGTCTRRWCTPWTASIWPWRRAKSSAWSANRAAASPRSAAWPSDCCRCRDGERLLARRSRSTRLGRRGCEAPAARDADDLPGSVRVAQSAHARGGHRRRGAGGASASSRRSQQMEYVGPDAQSRRTRSHADAPLSAPVLGRPARAHRHRPRARRQAANSSSATSRWPRSTCRSRRRC